LNTSVKGSFVLFVSERTTRIILMTSLGTRTGIVIIAPVTASAPAAKGKTLRLS